MVTGMVFPAYAAHVDRGTLEPGQPVTLPQTSSTVTPSSHGNLIYQNGNNPTFGLSFIDNIIVADDFVLSGGDFFDVSDALFIWHGDGTSSNIEPLEYFILADAGGQPGAVIDSGTAQNVQTIALGGEDFETRFDFVNPLTTLDPGVTYWFALTYMPATFTFEAPQPIWFGSDVVTGNTVWGASSLPPTTWTPFSSNDMWFQLTGFAGVVNGQVGGEFLPIDSTALVLAGLQTSAIWMLPVLAGVAGSAFGILYIKSRRN